MTCAASVVLACTAAADDNGMRALHDVAAVADGIEYLVIGGHMVRSTPHLQLAGTRGSLPTPTAG